MARRAVCLLLAAAEGFAAVFFLLAVFLAGRVRAVVVVLFFELLGVAAADLLERRFFDLAVEADFFLVTFFRASFRLDVDLPALAFFFEVFFLAAFLAAFFLLFFRLVAFFRLAAFFREAVFLRDTDFFREGVFLRLAFFLVRADVEAREVFFAAFLPARFLAAAFLVGIQEIPEWLQMQPAIIHRCVPTGSPVVPRRAGGILRAN